MRSTSNGFGFVTSDCKQVPAFTHIKPPTFRPIALNAARRRAWWNNNNRRSFLGVDFDCIQRNNNLNGMMAVNNCGSLSKYHQTPALRHRRATRPKTIDVVSTYRKALGFSIWPEAAIRLLLFIRPNLIMVLLWRHCFDRIKFNLDNRCFNTIYAYNIGAKIYISRQSICPKRSTCVRKWVRNFNDKAKIDKSRILAKNYLQCVQN